jgi:hypothetical protein
MATKRVKNEDERLDDAHMDHVIKMLEPTDGTKAWTKKECCAYLGITYNTTRLGTLIEKYKERKAADAARRAEKRGKPATDGEIAYIISSYLEGGTIDSISSALYRGSTFVRSILDRFSVPIRNTSHSYFRPGLVPEEAIRTKFTVGEVVYSMRYDSLAKIRSEFSPGVYAIYLMSEKQQQFAYQPAEELASLEHLKKYIHA